MLEPLAVAAWLAIGRAEPRWPSLPVSWPAAAREPKEPPTFDPEDRSVSNWREGTRRTLEPAPLAIVAGLFLAKRPVVSRCVKLNNPWCIKRARWAGELAGDEEGHTAFASTEHGADAAAALLRSYYVTHGRRSALEIVRRWAPAECRIGDGSGLAVALAVRGLANTLRARFLAAQGGRGTAQPRARAGRGARTARVSVVPPARVPVYRVPDLAAGLGERPLRPERGAGTDVLPAPARNAAQPAAPVRQRVRVASIAATPPPTASNCGSEEGRIQYYGTAIARALGVAPTADLKLFDREGQPTQNLVPVMVAMSAVELGYLHAGPELVGRAIARLRLRLSLTPERAAASGEASPPASEAVVRDPAAQAR